jgi:nicotinate-nucleotide pyrophosphorylase (carboxylating)
MIPADRHAEAVVVAREPCVVAGLALFGTLAAAFARRTVRRPLRILESVGDGRSVNEGDVLCRIGGDTRSLLTLERTLLNFLARLSGIATLTACYVEAARKTGSTSRILDTRKTTPGHRVLEKYAVSCGGGHNHRLGLFDAVLIKDNHVAAAGGITAAVEAARAAVPGDVRIEVECDGLDQVREALDAGAPGILLDNFTPQRVAEAVALVAGRARLEVSGGVTLDTVAAYAATGVDDISVGRLTHSAASVDLSLELRPPVS